MKCNNCGFDSNNSEDIFCNYCGSRLSVELPKSPDYMSNTNSTSNHSGNNFSANNSFSGNPYSSPTPTPPVNKPSGKPTGGKSGVVVAIIVCAVIVCAIIVSCTALIITKSGNKNEATESASQVQQGATEKETSAFAAEDTSYYDGEDADEDAEIPAGTRCRVDSYIDGNNSLQLRSTPNKNDKINVYAGRNNYVTVLEDYYGGDFIKISILTEGHTHEGWVYAEYLHTVSDDEGIERTELSPGTECHVTYSDGLNLWKKPHSSDEKRKKEGSNGKAPYGATVEIVYQYNINDNGYVYASYNGTKGWVDAEYLEVGSSASYTTTTKVSTTEYDDDEDDDYNSVYASDLHEIFRNAQMTVQEYFCLDESVLDLDDSITRYSEYLGQDATYYRTKNLDSADELYDILHRYISDDGCRYFIDLYYTESDGKLYHLFQTWDMHHTYEVQREDHYAVGDKIKYVLDVVYVHMDERSEEPALTYYFVKENGSWLLQSIDDSDLAVDFVCRCPLCG